MRTFTFPAAVLSLACCCLIIIACSSDTAPTESMPSAVSLSQQVVVGDRVTIKANCKGSSETDLKFTVGEVHVLFDEGPPAGVRLFCSPQAEFRRTGVPRHVSVVVDDVGGSWRVRISLITGGLISLCRPFEGTTLPSGPMICTFLDSGFSENFDKAFLESGVVVTMN